MNHVFIRSQQRRGILVGTMAVPEQLPTGQVTVVAFGVIAVGQEWVITPLGDTVLLVKTDRDESDERLAEVYPPVQAPPLPSPASALIVPAMRMP